MTYETFQGQGREQRSWTDDTRSPLAAVEDELRQAKATIDRYLNAFESGAMTPEDCGARLPKIRERSAALERRRTDLLDALQIEPTRPNVEALLAIAAEFASELEQEEPPRLKEILRQLIERLTVESRALIRPVFRVPLVRLMGSWVGPPGLEPGTNGL